MKKSVLYTSLVASLFTFSNISSAGSTDSIAYHTNSTYFYTEYTTTKDCGFGAVYVGPNQAHEHGGVCLFPRDIFSTHTSYTANEDSCNAIGGAYGGPKKAGEHGGTCIWIKGLQLTTRFINDKVLCGGANTVYVGPNRADKHGGVCLTAAPMTWY